MVVWEQTLLWWIFLVYHGFLSSTSKIQLTTLSLPGPDILSVFVSTEGKKLLLLWAIIAFGVVWLLALQRALYRTLPHNRSTGNATVSQIATKSPMQLTHFTQLSDDGEYPRLKTSTSQSSHKYKQHQNVKSDQIIFTKIDFQMSP